MTSIALGRCGAAGSDGVESARQRSQPQEEGERGEEEDDHLHGDPCAECPGEGRDGSSEAEGQQHETGRDDLERAQHDGGDEEDDGQGVSVHDHPTYRSATAERAEVTSP